MPLANKPRRGTGRRMPPPLTRNKPRPCSAAPL